MIAIVARIEVIEVTMVSRVVVMVIAVIMVICKAESIMRSFMESTTDVMVTVGTKLVVRSIMMR